MSAAFKPAYLESYESGLLKKRIAAGQELMKDCCLCPRECRVDRNLVPGKVCGIDRKTQVSSYFPHFGEEICLRGFRGSGTIFFYGCNLHCAFCQNWEISNSTNGYPIPTANLARMMIELQDQGCHNINLVTPSHVVVPILESLPQAIEIGLVKPLVYNTSGYDSLTALKLLDQIVDIYLTDVKFLDVNSAKRYLNAPDYPTVVRRNLQEMHRQVGDLVLDSSGIAQRGLLIRHLLMPGHITDTSQILNFIANELSTDMAVNLMTQYRPQYLVNNDRLSEINRTVTSLEYQKALEIARAAGLHRLL
ncbi:MAG: 4Fe-4S cluster-binding domain-containing protein [Candidatus Marinimicrobia bacterium]|nr:4Fe-4S cluster-binding domain-containing protein [Candidatus Neomarinimicrobiota bacterium]